MVLSDEQKQVVATWVAAGDNLSAVQRKLAEQFKISMTYMDVRFLVDDLNLQLKDAAPKADTNLHQADVNGPGRPPAGPEKKGFLEKAKEKLGLAKDEAAGEEELPEEALDEELDEDLGPAGGGNVKVTVDKVTLNPSAMASGTVAFSDGVTGKWIVDNYGRPGFTEISKPDYRPKAADAKAFVKELSRALQQRGI